MIASLSLTIANIMLKTPEKTEALASSPQEELLEKLVRQDHAFRTLSAILNFNALFRPYRSLYSHAGTIGIDIEKGLKALLVQFWEDLSDRQMENALQENVAIKWFCGFALLEATPDHTYFCKLRKRIGVKGIALIFQGINDELAEKGLFGDVFAFIDASSIVSKTALWKERDRAIKDGEEKLNNANVASYAAAIRKNNNPLKNRMLDIGIPKFQIATYQRGFMLDSGLENYLIRSGWKSNIPYMHCFANLTQRQFQ